MKVTQINFKRAHIVLAGDFNVNALEYSCSRKTLLFSFKSFNLELNVKVPSY